VVLTLVVKEEQSSNSRVAALLWQFYSLCELHSTVDSVDVLLAFCLSSIMRSHSGHTRGACEAACRCFDSAPLHWCCCAWHLGIIAVCVSYLSSSHPQYLRLLFFRGVSSSVALTRVALKVKRAGKKTQSLFAVKVVALSHWYNAFTRRST
jgi:hypothetical protein